jgi:hypothetical protein
VGSIPTRASIESSKKTQNGIKCVRAIGDRARRLEQENYLGKEKQKMKTFSVELRYQDRNTGDTSAGKVQVEGSSLTTAVAKGLRMVMKTVKDRKVRNDMAQGITIHAAAVGETIEKQESQAAQA